MFGLKKEKLRLKSFDSFTVTVVSLLVDIQIVLGNQTILKYRDHFNKNITFKQYTLQEKWPAIKLSEIKYHT